MQSIEGNFPWENLYVLAGCSTTWSEQRRLCLYNEHFGNHSLLLDWTLQYCKFISKPPISKTVCSKNYKSLLKNMQCMIEPLKDEQILLLYLCRISKFLFINLIPFTWQLLCGTKWKPEIFSFDRVPYIMKKYSVHKITTPKKLFNYLAAIIENFR